MNSAGSRLFKSEMLNLKLLFAKASISLLSNASKFEICNALSAFTRRSFSEGGLLLLAPLVLAGPLSVNGFQRTQSAVLHLILIVALATASCAIKH
jgi:hypothetical protein